MPISPGSLYTGQIDPIEICEFWMGDRSPSTASFNYKTANVHSTYWIPASKDWNGNPTDVGSDVKLKAFIQYAMGVDYVEQVNSTTFALRRQIPLFHPIHSSLYCDGIVSINGVAPRGDDPDNQYANSGQSVTPVLWDKHEVVLSFGMPKWRMRGDSQVTSEAQRYTYFKMDPSVQVVTLDKGNITLDGTPGGNKPTLQAAQRRESSGVTITWYRVPAEWVHDVSNPDYGFSIPRKLMMAQGLVNKEPFFGEPAETMQLMRVELGDPYTMPLISDIQGEQENIHLPYYAYDIVMHFRWTDPYPKGKAGETRHGWNLMLFNDLKYYYGTVEDSGLKTFRTFNANKLFTHWTDTFTVNADGSLD
jgi:hypothetical protein